MTQAPPVSLPAHWPVPGATLVLGGARSGKSRLAESLALRCPGPRHYVATAEAGDGEMSERIALHRERRGAGWQTWEEPLGLETTLERLGAEAGAVVLVDCLTLWLSNLMAADQPVAERSRALVAVLERVAAPVLLVSNEVGLGIVPEHPLARRFRDHAGRLHQELAARAPAVLFVAAGLPLVLKAPA
jgi:adenosylcobinamide kinase/adenosylcobinamide-phosphate guanylyltransferase